MAVKEKVHVGFDSGGGQIPWFCNSDFITVPITEPYLSIENLTINAPKNKRKAALIGYGYWGKKLEKYIDEYFDLVWILDSRNDWKNMLFDSTIECVFVATPIETHYSIVKDLLRMGKHVFVEKPITTSYDKAMELKELAEEQHVKLYVDYEVAESKTVNWMINELSSIGKIYYVEMISKHLGRFMDYDVFWLLASHFIPILDKIYSLDKLDFIKTSYLFHKGLTTTGAISFWGSKPFAGNIHVSLNHPYKELLITIYGEKGSIAYQPLLYPKYTGMKVLYNKEYKAEEKDLIIRRESFCSDENNNLQYTVESFNNLLDNEKESNIDIAIKTTKILEEIL